SAAALGTKPDTVGGSGTVKFVLLVTDGPWNVATVIGPVTAAVGTATVSDVELMLLGGATAPPPNVTLGREPKLAPLMITWVPGAPDVGVNDASVGLTVKEPLAVAVLLPTVTLNVCAPGAAFDGTLNTSCVMLADDGSRVTLPILMLLAL